VAPPLFRFDDVWVSGFGDEWRLREVVAEIPDDGITALVGPSGAGKSTLLRLCNRLEVPARGRVLLRDDDVAAADPLRLRRRVGMVFQRPTPFPGTVRENLQVAAPAVTDDAAAAALEAAELPRSFLDRIATELSGGEAQRVCLARTLLTEPEVLLMDEATSSLDPASRHALERLALALSNRGVRVLWVTHDFAQVRRVADHVLVVLDHRVAHTGPIQGLAEGAPDDVHAFLAEASDDE
jgi:putative ABC transport system ATP-binding protein